MATEGQNVSPIFKSFQAIKYNDVNKNCRINKMLLGKEHFKKFCGEKIGRGRL